MIDRDANSSRRRADGRLACAVRDVLGTAQEVPGSEAAAEMIAVLTTCTSNGSVHNTEIEAEQMSDLAC